MRREDRIVRAGVGRKARPDQGLSRAELIADLAARGRRLKRLTSVLQQFGRGIPVVCIRGAASA